MATTIGRLVRVVETPKVKRGNSVVEPSGLSRYPASALFPMLTGRTFLGTDSGYSFVQTGQRSATPGYSGLSEVFDIPARPRGLSTQTWLTTMFDLPDLKVVRPMLGPPTLCSQAPHLRAGSALYLRLLQSRI